MPKELLAKEISGAQIWRYAERIAQHNRIQGSPGFREAAEMIIAQLAAEGVQARRHSYPARRGERFLAMPSFQEWRCRGGELWLLDGGKRRRRLARYQDLEVSLVQRSGATPAEGVRAQLVWVKDAENPESYKDMDLLGKIALVRGQPMLIHALAVEQGGAVGLVFDNLNDYPPIRTRADMPDVIQYTSFWWHAQEQQVFGFAVSPRVGDELRALLANESVYLEANVDAELVDGSFENVEYFIPGRQEQEVLLVAHLCHPYPGAQDNASGPAVLMEVMRVLRRLIDRGELSQPDLGIRFLLVPEMTGTSAWFANAAARARTVAALNLDMVGADQGKGGGPLCVEQPPLSTATFADNYTFMLLDDISRDIKNFSGTDSYSSVHYLQTRFSGGSDHYIISDPALGIPCPMLIQWPDKYYHTSHDHPMHLDPNMLARVARVSAGYAWGLAAGSQEHWREFLLRDLPRSQARLSRTMEWVLGEFGLAARFTQALAFYGQGHQKALDAFARYAELRGFEQVSELIPWARDYLASDLLNLGQWCRERAKLVAAGSPLDPELSQDWANRVYARVYAGPINMAAELATLPVADRIRWEQYLKVAKVPGAYSIFIEYRLNGESTLTEALELVELETGIWQPDYAARLIELWEKLGIVARVR